MTLRKYKKLLMSYGIDRDQAEADRKDLAKWKRIGVKNGCDPAVAMNVTIENMEAAVSFRKTFGTTSRRGVIKRRKEILKNVTVV